MVIRKASFLDKNTVLDFCKSTFSWGDYISEVWDFWIKDGILLISEKNGNPVGMCHAVNLDKHTSWVEGIRVHPDFRKSGIGTELIKYVETISSKNNISSIYMLIEINNVASISLAKKQGYDILETWNFYTLNPQQYLDNFTSQITSNEIDLLKISSQTKFFIDSWRWIPLSNQSLKLLHKNNNLIYSNNNHDDSFGIMINSKHFPYTTLVTLFGTGQSLIDLLKYIQNACFKQKIKRIQVLTPQFLPKIDGLDEKMKFHLFSKQIRQL